MIVLILVPYVLIIKKQIHDLFAFDNLIIDLMSNSKKKKTNRTQMHDSGDRQKLRMTGIYILLS